METALTSKNWLPAFVYGGDAVALDTWPCEETITAETSEERRVVRTYTAPDGLLALRVTAVEYADFPAVKYLPELIGCGDEPSKIVSDFKSFALTLDKLPWAETILRATTGSTCQASDFAARTFALSSVTQQDELVFTSDEGLSSTNWMPYFGLELNAMDGYEFAIGWSGAWTMSVKAGKDTLRCAFGMKNFRSYVKPGETLRQPSVLLLKRTDIGVSEFRTVIHDFIIKHNAPRDSKGEIMKPIMPVTVSGGNRRPEDDLKVISYAASAGLPCDVVWMDAGWNGPEHLPNTDTNCGNVWWKYVGDWRVNTGIHTTGSLRPVSDAVHAAGRRFLLWFEPERVMESVPILQEHPEYARKAFRDDPENPTYILDLGNDEAFQWIFSTLCRVIDENGVDIYRQDFNTDPYLAWCNNDEPDRSGVNEVRHVTGLYRLWDALRKRYPDMLIDDCTAGGRRLDFEMLSRAHTYCRSDYFVPRRNAEKHKYQALMGQNAVLNLLEWVPFQGSEASSAETFCDYEFLSLVSTGIVFTPPDWEGGCVKREFSQEETAWFRKMLGIVERARKILSGKFYPLTDAANLSEGIWVAYEGIDTASGEGMAAFFRRRHAVSTMTFELKGISPDALYDVEDAVSGKVDVLQGRELLRYTVSFDQAPDGKVLFFKKH